MTRTTLTVDRRTSIDWVDVIQAEYLEMPGLQLTEAQAARLWSFDSALCSAVLTALVESRFLVRSRNSAFSRA